MPRDNSDIYTVSNKAEAKFLRKRTVLYDLTAPRKEKEALVRHMKDVMRRANGIGLSANQIGLPHAVFVAQVPQKEGGMKYYAIFNPKLTITDGDYVALEEGCLSIPGSYGKVQRAKRVVLTGFDIAGKPVKIKAWGLLAHVFQHEVDHLNGVLFTDKANEIYEVPRIARREEKREKGGGNAS